MSVVRSTTMVLVALLLAGGRAAEAEKGKPDEATIKGWLRDGHKRAGYCPQSSNIVRCGQLAVDCIMDCAEEAYTQDGGIYSKGDVPAGILEPIRDTHNLLKLLYQVDAPIPVDRLATLVEKGMGPLRVGQKLDVALALLATSGHERGKAMIELHRDMALKSRSLYDKRWSKAMEDHLKTWEEAHTFVTTGKPMKEPVVATSAMRRAYIEDGSILSFKATYSREYLAGKLAEYGPRLTLQDEFINTTYPCFGRIYEPLLAPAVVKWLEGDRKELERILGEALPNPIRVRGGKNLDLWFLSELVSDMSGDDGLKANLLLLKTPAGRPESLVNFPPEGWLSELGKGVAIEPKAAVSGILALSDMDRPFRPEEKKLLRRLLAVPKTCYPWVGSYKDLMGHASVLALAKKEPNLFRDLLKEDHLSTAVVDAIIREKLYTDRQQVYALIEAGTRWDYSPKEDSVPRNVNLRWLGLLSEHFNDADGIAFHVRLAKKEGFTRAFGRLADYGPGIVPTLVQEFQKADAKAKCAILVAVGRFKNKDKQVMDLVMTGLRDESELVRSSAAQRCLYAKPEGHLALTLLLELALSDENEKVQNDAASSVASLVTKEMRDRIPELRKMLDSESPEVRNFGVYAITQYGPNVDTLPDVIRMLKDKDDRVAATAARNIYNFVERRSDAQVDTLMNGLKDKEMPALGREKLVEMLGRVGAKAGKALLLVRGMLDDDDPKVRKSAAYALKCIEGEM